MRSRIGNEVEKIVIRLVRCRRGTSAAAADEGRRMKKMQS
jgi:hypothetical protein